MENQIKIILLCLALIAAATAFFMRGPDEPAPTIVLSAEIHSRLQPGDLIFRIGDGWQSEVVRNVANTRQKRGDPYSHVGMLVGSPGHWQVVHAVPAETPHRTDTVVRDDLYFFLSPERARGVAIYRIAADAISRSAAVEYVLQRLGTPFRIVENDHIGQYCTTLVWAAWQRAGVDLGAHFEHLEVPFSAGDYLLPHSLRTAPGLQLIFEHGPPGAVIHQ
jgi:cell wall-associated NlpC family hydrolase